MMLFCSFSGSAYAAASPDITAEAAILLDGTSGKILYEKNADELLPPASMTKMMTEYLILEAVKKGKIKWEQQLSISQYAHDISQKRNLSNVPLRIDLQYSVKELFEAAGIYSANGAAIALSEAIAGNETAFVKKMNDKAAEMGLKEYKFVNCTGLNNSDLLGLYPPGTDPNAENMISARAAAILAYNLLKDYPEILKTSSIPKKTFREGTTDFIKMDNWNWMLPSLVYAYPGVDGLKTGSTNTAGYSFTGTVLRGDVRLISVVMKADSYKSRFSETARLFDYGFNNFVKKEILPAGYKIAGKSEVTVLKGKAKKVVVATKKPLISMVKSGEENLYEPVYELTSTAFTAPIKKGQVMGHLTLKYKGEGKYGYITPQAKNTDRVEVVATQEVKKANFLVLFFRWIMDLVLQKGK